MWRSKAWSLGFSLCLVHFLLIDAAQFGKQSWRKQETETSIPSLASHQLVLCVNFFKGPCSIQFFFFFFTGIYFPQVQLRSPYFLFFFNLNLCFTAPSCHSSTGCLNLFCHVYWDTKKPNSTAHSITPWWQFLHLELKSSTARAHPAPPPLSALCGPPSPLSDGISVWQRGSQSVRWCNEWGTDPSHVSSPTPMHLFRFLIPSDGRRRPLCQASTCFSNFLLKIYFCTK